MGCEVVEMKRMAFLMAAALILAGQAFAEDKKPAKQRTNRVEFGSYMTGLTIELASAAYKDAPRTNWLKYSAPQEKNNVWVAAPADMVMAENVASRIPVIATAAPTAGCGMAPRLIFLAGPSQTAAVSGKLYAYEYNICDTSGLLSTDMMMDQYISKYGVYDEKDYDRKMIIYNNVSGKYRVGVRPLSGVNDKTGITVTVIDDSVFRDTYGQWRMAVRKAARIAKQEF